MPQPLSRPQGTMPTALRRQHCWSNTDTQVQLLHSDIWRTLLGFNYGIGCVGQLIQDLGSINSHVMQCKRQKQKYAKRTVCYNRTEITPKKLNAQEGSLKEQCVNITEENEGLTNLVSSAFRNLGGGVHICGIYKSLQFHIPSQRWVECFIAPFSFKYVG